jgi:hypothetical protein
MTIWNIANVSVLSRSPRLQLTLLFAVVLLSRLPFLDAGYGVHVDAWRVARVAREVAMTGEYSVSRFPGYPLQEIVCSWFWQGGPIILNGLSALFSAAAATAFAEIARKLQCRHWWLAGLALAATPIFFISSVCSKDFVWAIAFVLLSVLASLHGKSVVAGMLLGLATGCRITSLAMLLPIGLILVGQGSGRKFRSLLGFALAALVTSALLFSPVWLRYGTTFFTFYDIHRPDWMTMMRRGTVEVWGSLGLVGLTIALGALILKRKKIPPPDQWIVAALLCATVIYVAAYLRLPDQAGYLVPIVPCVLLLLNMLTPRRIWQAVCLLLIVAPLADVWPRGFTAGAIFRDRVERLQTMERIHDFVVYSQTLSGRNTIVIGAWEPRIAVMAPQLSHSRNHYAYLLSEIELLAALQSGDQIFYGPGMREFNYYVYGVDLAQYGALDLRAFFMQEQNRRSQVR